MEIEQQKSDVIKRYSFKNLLFLSLLILILILLIPNFKAGAATNTYYVATNGNDNNTGTLSQPFKTIQKAANVVDPGDTVIVEDGIYSYGSHAAYQTILSRSGNSGAYITFKARNIGGAILDGNNYLVSYAAFSVRASYINISGFEIRKMNGYGAEVQATGTHVNFSDMYIHDIGNICSGGGQGYYINRGSYITIERNLFHNIGMLSPADGCSYASGWTGYTSLDHAIYVDGVSHLTVKNNVFYNIKAGWALQLYSGLGHPIDSVDFINNTCENGNPYQDYGHVVLWGNMSNVLIANNIFKNQHGSGVGIYQGSYTYSNVVITKNMTSGGSGITTFGTATGMTTTNNYNNTNPLFVNEANHDYRLQSTSPAINNGYATGLTTDYLGNSRTIPIDIGAYEYQGAVTPTTYLLTINKAGAGAGTVSGAGSYTSGQVVTATATASSGSTFTGWSGDCNSSGQVTMTSVKTCLATFNLTTTGVKTYYVATNGNDNNTGTLSLPFKTIQKAVDVLTAGDTAFVRAGTYHEEIVFFEHSGTTGSPITLKSYPGETAIIDGANSLPTSRDSLVMIYSSFVNISGFEIKNSVSANLMATGVHCTISNINSHGAQGSGIFVRGDYDIVEDSHIWNNALSNQPNPGSVINASGLSAARNPNYAILRRNVVHDNWGEGLSTFEATHTLIENNTVYDNWSTNIYISDATDVLLQRNFVYNTKIMLRGSMIGILMGDEVMVPKSARNRVVNNIVYKSPVNFEWWGSNGNNGMDNFLIANNTFVNATGGEYNKTNVWLINGLTINSSFKNNIIYQDTSGGVSLIGGAGTNPELHFSNNLWSSTPISLANGLNDIIGNPLFAGQLTNNAASYVLTSSSPAINKGVNVGLSSDYLGNPIVGLPDIGAYEYQGAVTPTSYTLTTSATNGTIAKSPSATTYNSGTNVTLTPTPSAGYAFSSWSGDATGSTNPLTITMTANKNITANFSVIYIPTTYTLTTSATNGSITKSLSDSTYNSGTSIILTPVANNGYIFSSWSGDATGSSTSLTINMTADKNIIANFIIVNNNISNDDNNGGFSVGGVNSGGGSVSGVSGGGGGSFAPVFTPTVIVTATAVNEDQNKIIANEKKSLTIETIKQVISSEEKKVTGVNQALSKRLAGRILLQTETHGQAWYLDPVSEKRYYLADGETSFNALRRFGLGITNADIAKIPVGLESRFTMTDSDYDGLSNQLEEALGTNPDKVDTDGDSYADGIEVQNEYNPLSSGRSFYSLPLINRLKGRIVLQTESKGAAWYINPVDGKRYYLANGEAAYQIMRYLSLGISNINISGIPVGK